MFEYNVDGNSYYSFVREQAHLYAFKTHFVRIYAGKISRRKERKMPQRRSSKRTSNDLLPRASIPSSGERLVWYKHALCDGYDDFDSIEEECTARNTASLLDDSFYFARRSPPLPRAVEDVKDTPSTSFDEDLHADLLAMRAKNLADERKRRERFDSNLRVLYETRFKMNARCRRESRRVRALRA